MPARALASVLRDLTLILASHHFHHFPRRGASPFRGVARPGVLFIPERSITIMKSILQKFVSVSQLQALREACSGEEGRFFEEKLAEVARTIDTMPVTYQQDGKGDAAQVYLHYFSGGSDWWITEKDKDGGVEQAFGLASINGYDPELGYISIEELVSLGVELDLYWTQKTVGEIRQEISAREARGATT